MVRTQWSWCPSFYTHTFPPFGHIYQYLLCAIPCLIKCWGVKDRHECFLFLVADCWLPWHCSGLGGQNSSSLGHFGKHRPKKWAWTSRPQLVAATRTLQLRDNGQPRSWPLGRLSAFPRLSSFRQRPGDGLLGMLLVEFSFGVILSMLPALHSKDANL